MFFSYRARRALRHVLPVLLVVVILLLLAVIGWLLWLPRFVVYTQQGVRLDFSLQLPASSGVAPQRPGKDSVVVEYPDGDPLPTQPPEVPEDPDLPEDPVVPPVQSGIEGYYLDAGTVQKLSTMGIAGSVSGFLLYGWVQKKMGMRNLQISVHILWIFVAFVLKARCVTSSFPV